MTLQLVGDFSTELDSTRDPVDLERALGRICGALGFDHFALSLEACALEAASPELLLHNYPAEWARIYTGFELAGRDPVRRACDHSFIGFAWGEIGSLIPLTRGDRQMLNIGRECGLDDGFTVPRNLPGLARGTCSFVVRPGRRLPAPSLPVAELVAALALTCALGLSGLVRRPATARLTDRQRECLLWTARGKTAAETAIILGISTETVIQHLKLARERYAVHCKQSLVLSALFDGVIGFADVFRLPGSRPSRRLRHQARDG
ncbi:LuxR family transcriptional regulator [Qipengyuania sp. 6D47A]|uniref:LuxR family transcriptional regulator n=2 Tax=Qipengyuania qiaonensis TaxID=2867240 RepID=A0ABS7J6I1_9SPHN|nr:LuxR family transcriptional regulator [Qipengyuania qiaonensis]MBX7481684.1 LuxR family transcriptional regulator [Qipengyuania qiaonensis]